MNGSVMKAENPFLPFPCRSFPCLDFAVFGATVFDIETSMIEREQGLPTDYAEDTDGKKPGRELSVKSVQSVVKSPGMKHRELTKVAG